MHDCWNMPVYSGGLNMVPFVQHEGVIGRMLAMICCVSRLSGASRFRQQNARLNALLHQQLHVTSVISAWQYVAQLALTASSAKFSNSC